MTPPQRNMPGNILGNRYMLLSLIAKGGMGEVWKSRDQLTGKVVATKVLRPELSGESLPLNRLRLEAQNALLIEHPNIASVFDSGEDNGRGWIVMELIDGRPLTDYLKGRQRIAPEFLIPVLIQMAMALGAASQAGVVHRDIKPANVLIRPNGTVKLTDFGISRTKDQVDLTQAGMVMGTAQYLPPEQALGELATAAGDLYSVGVIAYEACAGRRPFTGNSQVDIAFAHVHDPVPPLPSDVPEPLAAVIYHLLEKEPSKRPESGRALMRELVDAARALDIPITARPLPEPAGSSSGESVSRTAAQAAVAPVQHTPRRSLPDEMLAPVDMSSAHLDALLPEEPASHVAVSAELSLAAPQTPVSSVRPAGGDPVGREDVAEVEEPVQPWSVSASVAGQTGPAGQRRSLPPAIARRIPQDQPLAPSSLPAFLEATKPFPPAESRKVFGAASFFAPPRQGGSKARGVRGGRDVRGRSGARSHADEFAHIRRPVRTAYSRSVVAPPLSLAQQALRWFAAFFVALLVFGVLSFAAYSFVSSRLPGASVSGAPASLVPLHTVGALESFNYQEARHV